MIHTRLKRREQVAAIGVEHNLARSYSTVQECQAKAKAVFAGASVVRCEGLPGTIAPGDITSVQPSGTVYPLGVGISAFDVDGEHIPQCKDNGRQMASASDRNADGDKARYNSTNLNDREAVPEEDRLPRPKNLKDFK